MHYFAIPIQLALLALIGQQEPAPLQDVSLTVTFERASGDPLVGAGTSLWAGEWTPGSVIGSSVVSRGMTDSSGTYTFRGIEAKLPALTAFAERRGPPPLMHVELDVVGERVTFLVDGAALTARAATFTAPPLGVLAVRVMNVDDEGRARQQGVRVRDADLERTDPMISSFAYSEDGVLRRTVPLGRSFEVNVLDRRVLGALSVSVEGPRIDDAGVEVVEVGPLTPDDHVAVHLVTGLAPDELREDTIVHVVPLPRQPADSRSLTRVRLGPADFDPEGELMLFLDRAFLQRPAAALQISLWENGAETCEIVVDVAPELVAGARLDAPLGDARAAALVPTPASELVVTGVVVDAAGRPVPNAEITVCEEGATRPFETFQSPNMRRRGIVLTDAEGAFEVHSDTDAPRFQLRIVGAGVALPLSATATRGQRDLRVTSGPTAEVRVRVRHDADVRSERFVIDLVERTDGGIGTRHMRALGDGEFVVETRAQGQAELRVAMRMAASVSGEVGHQQRLHVATLPLDLGDVGGLVRADDLDLRGRLVRLDPRAVDALSGAPLSDATYLYHVARGDEVLDPRSFGAATVGEATYVPMGDVTLIVDAPGRIPMIGAPTQELFALAPAPRVALVLEDEFGEALPEDWQFRIDARLAELVGVDGVAASMLRSMVARSEGEALRDGEGRELVLRWPGRWTLDCRARHRAALSSHRPVRLDGEGSSVVVGADTPTGDVRTQRVRLGRGVLAELSADTRPRPTVAATVHTRTVVQLELRDADGAPYAQRRVQARWCWPGAEVDGAEGHSGGASVLVTDRWGRVSLPADGVPLELEALELEVITDPRDPIILHSRGRWSAREPHRNHERSSAPWITVAGNGAVRLDVLEPAVTGRVLDRAGEPASGARLVWGPVLRSSHARNDFAAWLVERSSQTDAEGRFARYALPGLEPLMLSGLEESGGCLRLEPRAGVSLERGARDVVVTAERLVQAVFSMKVGEGFDHSMVDVELLDARGVCHPNTRVGDLGRERRREFLSVEPGIYTLRVSVAASMREVGSTDRNRRTLFESTPLTLVARSERLSKNCSASPRYPVRGSARDISERVLRQSDDCCSRSESALVLPSLDLSEALWSTQVTVALDGALPFLFGDGRQPLPIGVFALGTDGELERGGAGPDAWIRPRRSSPGRFDLLTRSPRVLVLDVAGALEVAGAQGQVHTQVVRSERTPVGRGVPFAAVALEALPFLQLSVSSEVVTAVGPHFLYAIAWRTEPGDANGLGQPTASIDLFDERGELNLPMPAPWPGLGGSMVGVELVLVPNPEPKLRNRYLSAALAFPRVRKKMLALFLISLAAGDRVPKHPPSAERSSVPRGSPYPVIWRQVVSGDAAEPMRLEVSVTAIHAARELLRR